MLSVSRVLAVATLTVASLAAPLPARAEIWAGWPDFTPDNFNRYDWIYIDIDTAWDPTDPVACGLATFVYINIQGYQDDAWVYADSDYFFPGEFDNSRQFHFLDTTSSAILSPIDYDIFFEVTYTLDEMPYYVSTQFRAYTQPPECSKPNNFNLQNGQNIGNGEISFVLTWGSTTGNNADLGACKIGEQVVQLQPNPWPVPFPDRSPPEEPTFPVPATAAGWTDMHQTSQGLLPKPFRQQYVARQIGADQTYLYVCTCTGGINNPQYAKGPYGIGREVFQEGGVWKFRTMKADVANGWPCTLNAQGWCN